ncbi:MAG: tRNA pseudouridine synthase A [Bacteroidales bacterium]|nr:tRNA pseudouridine synthase A [Bacteroidales bacterium]
MRYCLCLSYDGSSFCGWQIQPNAPSVQATLEATLSRLLNRPVAVTGAGRTDTSVHAVNYVAHIELDTELPFGQSDFCYKLNAMLPRSIVIHSVTPVPEEFHARFSARRREYTYFIHRQKDPFLQAYSWQCGYPKLDFDAMNAACQYLTGTHDFSCFEKTGGDNKTSLCTVFDAFWAPYTPSHLAVMGQEEGVGSGPVASRPLPPAEPAGPSLLSGRGWPEVPEPTPSSCQNNYWYFRIAADRFLRNMVRATVGSLIEVGRGKHAPEWIAELIESGTRGDAGESVPGHALFLNKVLY